MGIATRFVRLVKADLHGVMDHMEDKGLMLKQCLRDMEAHIDSAEEELKHMEAVRERALDDHARVTAEIQSIEKDLTLAMDNERDDIARNLIRRLKPRQSHAEEIDRKLISLQKELADKAEKLDADKREYERVSLEADRFLGEIESRRQTEAWTTAQKVVGAGEPSEEEVELELLRRKENRKTRKGKEKAS